MLARNIKNFYKNLLKKNNSLILHSFSHLYYKNDHPNFLNSSNFSKKFDYNNKFVIKFLKNIKFFLGNDYSKSNSVEKLENKIFIISHRLNYKNNHDIYFREIKKKLGIKNYISININHTERETKSIKPVKNEIILSKKLNLIKEIYLIIQILITIIKFPQVINNRKNFKDNCSVINQSLYNLRIYFQIKEFIEKFKPKCIFFTYEGYSYERLICNLCKKHNIISYGYQSSVILKSTYSIFNNYGKYFNPDIILSKNTFNYNLIEKRLKIKNIKLLNIGLKNNKIFNNISKNINNKTVLVIPEGIYSECVKLFKFSYDCALKNKNIIFIWRIHPLFNWKNVKKYLNINSFPKNIIFSKNKLAVDLKKSAYCLYRGSGTIFECIKNNLVPLYLHCKNDMSSLDPLFNINKNNIYNIDDFFRLIKKFSMKKNKKVNSKKYKKLKNILFENIDKNKILKIT